MSMAWDYRSGHITALMLIGSDVLCSRLGTRNRPRQGAAKPNSTTNVPDWHEVKTLRESLNEAVQVGGHAGPPWLPQARLV
jgi:hypothetical protein